MLANKHVLWLDVPVNHPLVVCVLEGLGNLVDIRDNDFEWQTSAFRTKVGERTSWSVAHHKKRDGVFYSVLKDTNNMRMLQVILYPCLRVVVAKIKVKSMGSLPPALISPLGMKA